MAKRKSPLFPNKPAPAPEQPKPNEPPIGELFKKLFETIKGFHAPEIPFEEVTAALLEYRPMIERKCKSFAQPLLRATAILSFKTNERKPAFYLPYMIREVQLPCGTITVAQTMPVTIFKSPERALFSLLRVLHKEKDNSIHVIDIGYHFPE